MASSNWDRVGQAASVMQVTGVDASGLVSMIVQAAHTARRNRDLCQQLAQHVLIVADLLQKLDIPALRQHLETRRPLEQLDAALFRAYKLVRSCAQRQENTSQIYQMFTGAEVASKLRLAQEEIDRYINLIPMITLVAAVGARQATNEVHEDGSNNDAAPTQSRNRLSLRHVAQLLALEELQPQGPLARTLGLEYLPAGGPRRFSYAELKQATKDFSDVVGRGAYGTVYRGELPDRRAVAVKQLQGVGGGEAEFWAEVTIIARMHHLNLVRMWGFCADKDQRMLVYEYVPNGSLDKYLFAGGGGGGGGGGGSGEEGSSSEQQQQPLLDLHTRYRIALGVARAIAYLHEECLEWVLHCDIKPENILLEDDFCPKVSDFGLSKLTSKKEKVTMSRIRGTRGYMAPEWVIHREPITAKADVYSFGMVLLEIVSGRRNYGFRQESVGSEDWYFPKWAYEKVYVERRIDDILDPRIAASYDDAASVATVERMVKTAMWCLQDRAEMRPSMGKVAKMLEGSVEITEPVKPTIFCVQDD